jgi:fumarate hydratase subunit beta
MATYELNIPIPESDVRSLHIGDTVCLSGVMVTGRDTAHKYLIENFIRSAAIPESEHPLYRELQRHLREGVIYHCGPVVRQISSDSGGEKGWEFVAAGPTTSIREEPYEADVIAHFGLRGVIGKGGMGLRTLQACREHGAAYFHAVGGAASLIANTVKEVVTVYKKDEFGVPEAFWIIRVEGFPVVVTMDTHGQSIHDQVEAASGQALNRLLAAA